MAHLDRKFHGILIKNKDNSIIPDDQWLVFLAKDNAVPRMLEIYKEECIRQGASWEQVEAVDTMIHDVKIWRLDHMELCRAPDVEPGELS